MLRKRFTPRDQYLIVRLTPKEKEKIQRNAEKQKLTTSEYVRRLAESPQKLTLRDIRHTLIDCKFLALGVRDDITAHIVESGTSTTLNSQLSAAQDKINHLEEELTLLASNLIE